MRDCKHIFPKFLQKHTLYYCRTIQTSLDIIRQIAPRTCADSCHDSKRSIHFSWVVDFPLFEYNEETKSYDATHHPFTSPQEGWENLPPEQIKARAYDVVLNGIELGGGSIRIHDAHVQDKVFELIGLSKEQARAKFGFLLEAQEYGFPPHGGIALGFDRLLCSCAVRHQFVMLSHFQKLRAATIH